MIAWVALAVAGVPDPSEAALQAVAERVWRRVPAAELAAVPDGGDRRVALAKARGLGQLRSAAALAPLRELLAHADPEVRAQAAFALGLTPGSAPVLRARLGSVAPPTAFLEAERAERWQLIEALGRAGERADLPRLRGALAEGWPWDEAACRALGRLHRRGVDARAARPDLVERAIGGDPRTVLAAAQTLEAIGLDGLPEPAQLALVQQAERAPTSEARAALVRALLRDLPDEGDHRAAIQRFAAWDTPAVRAAAIEGDTAWRLGRRARPGPVVLAPGPGGVDELLRAADPWLRLPAIGALAWRPATPDVQAWLAGASVFEQSLGIRAQGQTDPRAYDPSVPWPVRAAWLRASTEVDALVQVAVGAPAGWPDGLDLPGLRTAAVARLAELDAGPEVGQRLLLSPDPVVRRAGLGLLTGPLDPGVVEDIVLSLRVESDGEVLRAGFERLGAIRGARPGSVRPSRFLLSALQRGAAHSAPPVRDAALRLAADLQVQVQVPPPDLREHERILPDGTVITTRGELPLLRELARVRGAVLHTTAGALRLRLDPEVAPLAVHAFAQLARADFFAGQVWHRVLPGQLAASGCPRGDGAGGPGWTVVDELSDRPFVRGALGVEREVADAGGSRFVLATGSARALDGELTWFGELTEGWEVLRGLGPDDRITRVELLHE